MHYWQLSADADGFIILHTEQFYDINYTKNRINQFPFFASIQNPPYLYADTLTTNMLCQWFKMSLIDKHSKSIYSNQKISCLLNLIYIQCAQSYTEQNNVHITYRQTPDKFSQLEKLIEQNYRSQKSPASYACMLNITPKHLNRITQKAVAKTTSEVIADRVILEAKRELILQKQSFTQISLNLGYEDYAYFSRIFKNKTGETPSQFLIRYNTVK